MKIKSEEKRLGLVRLVRLAVIQNSKMKDNSTSWNQMIDGLKTYRKLYGKYGFISAYYVIPSTSTFPPSLHGIKLGQLLERVRKSYRTKKLNQSQIDLLEKYFVHWDYDIYRIDYVCLPALDMYKEIHKDLRVPVGDKYVVPDKQPWPEHLWGMKLGRQVARWRTFKETLPLYVLEALNDRDFIWDVPEKDFERLVLALKIYKKLKGTFLIPKSFRVPELEEWPTDLHGIPLGETICTLRAHRGIETNHDEILDAMDFTWDPIRYRFEAVMLPACKMYLEQKGDLNTISKSFRVPKTNIYPIQCRGYRLGRSLHSWRENGAPRPDLLEEIKALGFKPDPVTFFQRDLSRLLMALRWFQGTFGYKKRVIKTAPVCLPDDHPTLPGLSLTQLFFRAKKFDEKIGFSNADRKELKFFGAWNSSYQSTISPLMELYFKLNKTLDIPVDYTVPSSSPWPTWSWEQKLGLQANNIRQRGISLSEDEKDVLDTMDFKWGIRGRTPHRASKRHREA